MLLTPREGSRSLKRQLVVCRAAGRAIHIYGPPSPHTETDPYVVLLREVRDVPSIVQWMTTLATKGWGATPADLLTFARIALEEIEARS